MKKSLRKLIPTFVMLIITAALIGTSTFAWFSMNTKVSVTGMQVSANSNTTYLLISNANTGDVAPANAAAIQAENTGKGYTSLTLSAAAKEVYPVAPASAFTAATYYTAEDPEVDAVTKHVGDLKTNASKTNYVAGESVGAPTYWYTMVGTDATSTGYAGIANTEQDVTASAFTDYVLKYTFYFTIASGANAAANLVVDSIEITGDAAVRCLVVGTNGSALYSAPTDVDSISLETSLNSTTVYSVSVYVYYDGNAATIYTNNIPSIADTTVNLVFGVSVA